MKTRLLRELLAPDSDARCTTALVMYFCRHPQIYVATDWLAVQIGYGSDRVESSLETLIRAGVIVERRHAGLNAVMYRLSSPLWPPGLPATPFMRRWQRQIGLLRDARERCRRSELRAAHADERLQRAVELMTALRDKTAFPRDG